MIYKNINVNPKPENIRVIESLIHSEILAGNSLNSNEDTKDDNR